MLLLELSAINLTWLQPWSPSTAFNVKWQNITTSSLKCRQSSPVQLTSLCMPAAFGVTQIWIRWQKCTYERLSNSLANDLTRNGGWYNSLQQCWTVCKYRDKTVEIISTVFHIHKRSNSQPDLPNPGSVTMLYLREVIGRWSRWMVECMKLQDWGSGLSSWIPRVVRVRLIKHLADVRERLLFYILQRRAHILQRKTNKKKHLHRLTCDTLSTLPACSPSSKAQVNQAIAQPVKTSVKKIENWCTSVQSDTCDTETTHCYKLVFLMEGEWWTVTDYLLLAWNTSCVIMP